MFSWHLCSENIAVALPLATAFITTLVIEFGFEYFQTKMDKGRLSIKSLARMSTDLTEIKSIVNDLAKKIDAIQKELQD